MKEKFVYRNAKGQLHREDGPAIDYPDGYKEWFLNGKLHREDGPACEYTDGQEYWLNGKSYSKKDYYKEFVKRGIMTYEEAVLEML